MEEFFHYVDVVTENFLHLIIKEGALFIKNASFKFRARLLKIDH